MLSHNPVNYWKSKFRFRVRMGSHPDRVPANRSCWPSQDSDDGFNFKLLVVNFALLMNGFEHWELQLLWELLQYELRPPPSRESWSECFSLSVWVGGLDGCQSANEPSSPRCTNVDYFQYQVRTWVVGLGRRNRMRTEGKFTLYFHLDASQLPLQCPRQSS